jgi:hypothetical protein
MNTLVGELDNDPGDITQLKKDLSEAIQKPAEQPVEEPAPEAKKPSKYDGKSVDDVIDMHRNAESALGRTANELGQYKQLTDRLLDLKRTEDLRKGGADPADIEEEPLPELTSTDVLDNPTEAVAKVVDARLKRSELQRQREEAEAALEAASAEFAEKHPDAGEIASTPEFVEWVKASPLRRRAALAAYNKDFSAGSDLLDEYKASRAPQQEEAVNEEAILKEAKKASTVAQGSSQTGDIPQGKVYRRLDLIRLKLEDPEAYSDPAFQQEIMAAYAEGRVK